MPSSLSGLTGRKTAKNLSYLFSSLCLIHCLMMPVIILLLPAFSSFFSDTLETILILLVVPVSLYAFVPTWKKHRNTGLMVFFLLGLTLIMISQFGIEHEHITSFAELFSNSPAATSFLFRTLVLMAGVITLAVTVYRNNRHTHLCHNPHHVH